MLVKREQMVHLAVLVQMVPTAKMELMVVMVHPENKDKLATLESKDDQVTVGPAGRTALPAATGILAGLVPKESRDRREPLALMASPELTAQLVRQVTEVLMVLMVLTVEMVVQEKLVLLVSEAMMVKMDVMVQMGLPAELVRPVRLVQPVRLVIPVDPEKLV